MDSSLQLSRPYLNPTQEKPGESKDVEFPWAKVNAWVTNRSEQKSAF